MARPRKNLTTMPVTVPVPSQATAQQPQVANSPTAPVASVKNDVLFFIEKTKRGIDKDCIDKVETELSSIQSGKEVLLVIHTFGGDVYSSVLIVRIIQQKFSTIKAIIPDYAFSSGTIMSLGADEIHMDCDAMLGPLDLPMEHPHDGSEISSLDITNTLTNIASICTSVGMQMYAKLRGNDDGDLKMGKEKAATIAFDSATKMVQPIIDKIDPFILQRGFRETRIGLYYAIDLLYSRMMKGNFQLAMKTSRSLVNDYPSHGYGIFRDEARDSLKLKVLDLEKLGDWVAVKPTFEKYKDDSRYIKYLSL